MKKLFIQKLLIATLLSTPALSSTIFNNASLLSDNDLFYTEEPFYAAEAPLFFSNSGKICIPIDAENQTQLHYFDYQQLATDLWPISQGLLPLLAFLTLEALIDIIEY